ncbi:MAG TPA: histidine kinase dimerization/phospho-acceptor domain-containing protein, partial [Pyrinomonadaceae bacterium]|nr:histidine kinase dimerization/phospho-acceptor domain-containing protein [Pyrinomonadaceae bacterium]
ERDGHSVRRRGRLQALTDEIVDLFYTQTYSPDSISTPSEVCAAFAEMLVRHWELCCIIIYLSDEEDGRLRESAIHANERFDKVKGRRIGEALASAIERQDCELQLWLGAEDADSIEVQEPWRQMLEDAGLRACVAIPIRARGKPVGALIAGSSFPERLRAALKGIRFIAAPIVIAVGNARRTAALREQHDRIEHLVEELRQHSHALEEANRELQRVAHYRSLFLARMSHELRTPLTSILGFTEILLDQEELTAAQRRFCEKIQNSGLQLQTSLNQLVDLSRLEAGRTELFLHEFSLRETLRESCNSVARLAQKQSVRIDCHPASDLPQIVSDEGKLRQVLYNFFAYAISRSPAEATVTVRVESVSPSRFQIIIEDEGEPLRDRSKIFEPIDLSAPSEKPTNMTELGLVIARRLIDVIGGSIKLESPAPRGLRVSIELPTRPMKG